MGESTDARMQSQVDKYKARGWRICKCGCGWGVVGALLFIIGIIFLAYYGKYWGEDEHWERWVDLLMWWRSKSCVEQLNKEWVAIGFKVVLSKWDHSTCDRSKHMTLQTLVWSWEQSQNLLPVHVPLLWWNVAIKMQKLKKSGTAGIFIVNCHASEVRSAAEVTLHAV